MKGFKYTETLVITFEKHNDKNKAEIEVMKAYFNIPSVVKKTYFNSPVQTFINTNEIADSLQTTKQTISVKIAQWIS